MVMLHTEHDLNVVCCQYSLGMSVCSPVRKKVHEALAMMYALLARVASFLCCQLLSLHLCSMTEFAVGSYYNPRADLKYMY